MKVAVFGAGSLVGQELVVQALHEGHTVYAVVRGSESNALRATAQRRINVLKPLPVGPTFEQLRGLVQRERAGSRGSTASLSPPLAPASPPEHHHMPIDSEHPPPSPALTTTTTTTVSLALPLLQTGAAAGALLADRLRIVTSELPWSQEALQVIYEVDVVYSTSVLKLSTDRGHAMGLDRIITTMQELRRSNRQRAMRQRLIALVGESVLQATKNKLMMQLPGFSPKFHHAAVEHLAAWSALARCNLDWTLVCAAPIVAKVNSLPLSAPASPNSSVTNIVALVNASSEHSSPTSTVTSSPKLLPLLLQAAHKQQQQLHQEEEQQQQQQQQQQPSAVTIEGPSPILPQQRASSIIQDSFSDDLSTSKLSICAQDSSCDCSADDHIHGSILLAPTSTRHRVPSSLTTTTNSSPNISLASTPVTPSTPLVIASQGRSKSLSEAGMSNGSNIHYSVAVDVLPTWSPSTDGMTICRVNDVADFMLTLTALAPTSYSQMRVGIASNVRPGS